MCSHCLELLLDSEQLYYLFFFAKHVFHSMVAAAAAALQLLAKILVDHNCPSDHSESVFDTLPGLINLDDEKNSSFDRWIMACMHEPLIIELMGEQISQLVLNRVCRLILVYGFWPV